MNIRIGPHDNYFASMGFKNGLISKDKLELSLTVDGVTSKLTLYPEKIGDRFWKKKHTWKQITIEGTTYNVKSDKLNKEITLPDNATNITIDLIHASLERKKYFILKLRELGISESKIPAAITFLLTSNFENEKIEIPGTKAFVIGNFICHNALAFNINSGVLYNYSQTDVDENTLIHYPAKYSGAELPPNDRVGNVSFTLRSMPLIGYMDLNDDSDSIIMKPGLTPNAMNALMNTVLKSLSLMHRDGFAHNNISQRSIFYYNRQPYVGDFSRTEKSGSFHRDMLDLAKLLFLTLNTDLPDQELAQILKLKPDKIWTAIVNSDITKAKKILDTRKEETVAYCKKIGLSTKEYETAYNLIAQILENKEVTSAQLIAYKEQPDRTTTEEVPSVVNSLFAFFSKLF